MIESLYVLYKNNGQYFPTYDLAWKNRYNGNSKQVFYVFTPTMAEYKRVGDLERAYRSYMRSHFDCDFLDTQTGNCYSQLSLI